MKFVRFRLSGVILTAMLVLSAACSSTLESTQISPTATPEPEPLVFFPKQEPVVGERVGTSTLLIGNLSVVDESLQITSNASQKSYLLIWPPEYDIDTASEPYQVLDDKGIVVARVGEEVIIGGKEREGYRSGFSETQQANIPVTYTGRFWLVSKVYDLQDDVTMLGPDPLVYFPRQMPMEGEKEYPSADLTGVLIVVDKCLLVYSNERGTSHLPIWPFDYTIDTSSVPYRVLDGDGDVVAYVGDEICIGGGSIWQHWSELPEPAKASLPETCPGPYWLTSGVVIPYVEPMPESGSLVFFPRHDAAADALTSQMTGNLVVIDECLRLNTSFRASYMLIWPSDYIVDTSSEPYQVLNGNGAVVAYVGDKVSVSGGTFGLSESIRASIPKKCNGTCWFVGEVLDSQSSFE